VNAALRFDRHSHPRAVAALLGGLIGCLVAACCLAGSWRFSVGLVGAAALVSACVWIIQSPLRWWTLFVVSILVLPPLPFALGGAGPHVGLVFAGIGLWAGVARLRQWRFETTGTVLALVGLTFWLAATTVFAALFSGWGAAAAGAARVGLFGTSVYAFLYVAHGPGRYAGIDAFQWARSCFGLASASAALALVDFYYQWPPPGGFAEQFVWLPFGVFRRAQGVFYEAGMLGNLCALFLLMAAVAILRADVGSRVLRTPLLVAGSLVLAVAVAASFSRSSVLNVAAGLAALLLLEHRRIRIWRPVAYGALVALGAGVTAWLVAPEIFAAYLTRLGDSLLYAGVAPDALLSGRLETWTRLLRGLADSPAVLLTGIGFKTLPLSSVFGRPLIADNMYLSLLAETGIPGLVLLLTLSISILVAGFRARNSGSARGWFCGTWLICGWIGNLAQMLSVDALTYWRTLPLSFFLLALVHLELRRDGTRSEPADPR